MKKEFIDQNNVSKIVDMTEQEIDNFHADTKKAEADKLANEKAFKIYEAETKAKNAARQALLDKLGITADEAKLLLG